MLSQDKKKCFNNREWPKWDFNIRLKQQDKGSGKLSYWL